VEKRVELNAVTFQTNYLIVLVAVFLLGLFSSPFLLFVVLLCVALWCESVLCLDATHPTIVLTLCVLLHLLHFCTILVGACTPSDLNASLHIPQ